MRWWKEGYLGSTGVCLDIDCPEEAAPWCFERTDSFAGAVLLAATLGDDADMTAAVCGHVTGAYYGEASSPARDWR